MNRAQLIDRLEALPIAPDDPDFWREVDGVVLGELQQLVHDYSHDAGRFAADGPAAPSRSASKRAAATRPAAPKVSTEPTFTGPAQPDERDRTVRELLQAAPKPASAGQLAAHLRWPVRVVTASLQRLKRHGELIQSGKNRGARYSIPIRADDAPADENDE